MRIWPIIAVILGLLVQPSVAADVPVPNVAYSAQRIMESDGERFISGQVYHDRGKERWETTLDGVPQIQIMRPDLGKLIMYMPRLNMGMEMLIGSGPQFSLPADHSGPRPKAVGREDVAGESTTKYRTEVENDTGAPFIVFSWVTDDGIIMRIEGEGAEGKFIMYLKDLTRGPQDAALFELPAGAQIMPIIPTMLEQPK